MSHLIKLRLADQKARAEFASTMINSPLSLHATSRDVQDKVEHLRRVIMEPDSRTNNVLDIFGQKLDTVHYHRPISKANLAAAGPAGSAPPMGRPGGSAPSVSASSNLPLWATILITSGVTFVVMVALYLGYRFYKCATINQKFMYTCMCLGGSRSQVLPAVVHLQRRGIVR